MSDFFRLSEVRSSLIDLNPEFGNPGEPMLLYGLEVIRASLRRLFVSHIGSKSKIFDFSYGCSAVDFLQDPMDDLTAMKIKVSFQDAVLRHEPRVSIQIAELQVYASYELPGYYVYVPYTVKGLNLYDPYRFSVRVSNA